jgi:hypothetical protein
MSGLAIAVVMTLVWIGATLLVARRSVRTASLWVGATLGTAMGLTWHLTLWPYGMGELRTLAAMGGFLLTYPLAKFVGARA